ncbi:MAG: hypothetical protein U0R70_03630 [Solirubrobacteraceae bacterium]
MPGAPCGASAAAGDPDGDSARVEVAIVGAGAVVRAWPAARACCWRRLPDRDDPARPAQPVAGVDGPAGVYEDKVSDYVTSEPALDYTASTVLLHAAVAALAP